MKILYINKIVLFKLILLLSGGAPPVSLANMEYPLGGGEGRGHDLAWFSSSERAFFYMLQWWANLDEVIGSSYKLCLVRFGYKLTEFHPCFILRLALHLHVAEKKTQKTVSL